MKSIEVKTTQNVTLEYELAELRDRVVAFLIDLVVILIGMTIVYIIGLYLLRLIGDVKGTFLSIAIILVFFLYSLVIEILNNGQSVGKMVMKIQVIKTIGGQATFADYTARWVFRMIDIWLSLGSIAALLVASSDKSQRIGDLIANTAVIKTQTKGSLRLNDLLAIKTQDSYKPVYIQAKQLEEEHAILIKRTLERQREYRNLAHNEAVKLLADKIRKTLNVTAPVDKNDIQFLQTILNDYVVLTR